LDPPDPLGIFPLGPPLILGVWGGPGSPGQGWGRGPTPKGPPALDPGWPPHSLVGREGLGGSA